MAMNSIETRFAKIESQVRFQRRIIAFLIILLVAGISYGATAPIPEVIRARRFEVVNPVGRKVVVIESWKHGGWISTYSAKGKYRPSIQLSHTDDGHGFLTVFTEAGKVIIKAGGVGKGDGLLNVLNYEEKVVIYAAADNDGDGLLKVKSKSGKDLIYAGMAMAS